MAKLLRFVLFYNNKQEKTMAKDGTMRGGRRPGAGGKPKELAQKILDGQEATVLKINEMPEPADLDGNDMPKVDEWLTEKQHDGVDWQADKIIKSTWEYLKATGCEKLVTMQQIYSYAAAEARFIQCHRAISKYGFLAKHPTTGAPIESPYVRMVDKFSKQATVAWYAIAQIVKDNSSEIYTGKSPREAALEDLLSE